MADDPAAKVRLGVFVVSGVLLTIVAVFLFGAGRVFERTLPVHMYFSESVQGLDPGAEIKYRGVRIGRVTHVAIRSAEPTAERSARPAAIIQVDGRLLLDEVEAGAIVANDSDGGKVTLRPAVQRGLRVTIAWKDITGQKFLDVDFHDPKVFPPPDLGFTPEEPYLPTATGPTLADIQRDVATTISNLARIDYEGIARRVEKLLDTVTNATESLDAKGLSEKIGRAADAIHEMAGGEAMKSTMTHVDQIAAQLDAAASKLNEMMQEPGLARGLRDAASAATSAKSVMEEVQKRVPDLLHDVGAVVEEVRAAIRQGRIPETTESMRLAFTNIEGAGAAVTTMQVDVSRALEDVADALRRVGKLADSLERHPELLLSGRKPAKEE